MSLYSTYDDDVKSYNGDHQEQQDDDEDNDTTVIAEFNPLKWLADYITQQHCTTYKNVVDNDDNNKGKDEEAPVEEGVALVEEEEKEKEKSEDTSVIENVNDTC
ncbi:hypothetical protein FOL47_008574 [Perkinsus chesapeaki]|uniref:Uncharacterized protein n=1 Tax=Perkinsus chesapeaki TaxID=330153 RepID=A0A7J6LDH9_PERCH|nr:hypothetical protein FOL47_008574 [Perkinsus chesapeaki]